MSMTMNPPASAINQSFSQLHIILHSYSTKIYENPKSCQTFVLRFRCTATYGNTTLHTLPDRQKFPLTAHEISVNDLAQNVSNSTNRRAASVDSIRKSVKVGGPLVKLHNLSQSVTDKLTFVDRLADRVLASTM